MQKPWKCKQLKHLPLGPGFVQAKPCKTLSFIFSSPLHGGQALHTFHFLDPLILWIYATSSSLSLQFPSCLLLPYLSMSTLPAFITPQRCFPVPFLVFPSKNLSSMTPTKSQHTSPVLFLWRIFHSLSIFWLWHLSSLCHSGLAWRTNGHQGHL